MSVVTILLDALHAAPAREIWLSGALGAIAGAVLLPLLVRVAIKFNYKGMATGYAHIPQRFAFYRLFSLAGAGLFAILGASQPVLDAAGENEIYIRGALIPVIMVVIGWPFLRGLRRLR